MISFFLFIIPPLLGVKIPGKWPQIGNNSSLVRAKPLMFSGKQLILSGNSILQLENGSVSLVEQYAQPVSHLQYDPTTNTVLFLAGRYEKHARELR